MALRAVDQAEFAGRLAYLLRRAGMRANALSKEMNESPGFVSWLMTQAKTVPTHLVVPIAEVLAGQGDLPNDPVEIGKYLIGLRNDPPMRAQVSSR
jgi:hypothetical protein